MQNVLLERNSFPSHLVIKPKDLSRLLGHFQSSLQEMTLIATEPVTIDMGSESEAKAIELKSYIDPARGKRSCILSVLPVHMWGWIIYQLTHDIGLWSTHSSKYVVLLWYRFVHISTHCQCVTLAVSLFNSTSVQCLMHTVLNLVAHNLSVKVQ